MKKIYIGIFILILIAGVIWIGNQFLFTGIKPVQLNQDGFIANYFNNGTEFEKTAVVILGGGAFGDYWGSELAKAGHVGLSLPYHRLEGLPPLIEEIPLEYFMKAMEWLSNQPGVNQEKIILMGGSTNAELALLLAATFPEKVNGVVAWCPGSVCWSNTVFPWSSDEIKTKWTLNNAPVPFIPLEKIKGNDSKLIETLPYWNKGLDDSTYVQKASIKVENIKGPILLLTPEDDKVWPSLRMSHMIAKRLESNGFSYPFENIVYENAGHTIMAQYHKSFTAGNGEMWIDGKVYEFEYGGNTEGILAAQLDARKRVMNFIEKL